MPREKSDIACLWDMLDAARAVTLFVQGRSFQEYSADLMLRSAVERQVEILGEAARCVSQEFQQSHPQIPWQGIIGQRHVLAHDYGGIKHDRLWRVATELVPRLIELLEPLVPQEPPEPKS
ncbi:MAG TPA: HepT-like ribonuclease domain-containing protein [Phycisphaerae bacterium]|nr:HepT-like ribonuclease domain-containing protein [Phycisphaerae bacterium]